MDVTPEEQLHNDLWRVLQIIRKRELYWPLSDGKVVFAFSNPGSYDETADDEIAIEYVMLKKLEKLGAIIITPHEHAFILKILNPKFNELYEKYGTPYQIESSSLEKIAPRTNQKTAKTEPIIVYLETSGDLWREPKKNYCYPMMSAKQRQKLLRYFIDQTKISSRLIDTKEIALIFNRKEQPIRADIGKINAQTLLRLKIGRKEKMANGRKEIVDGIIEHRQGSGYHLSPKVKVIVK